VLGAAANATESVWLMSYVTCPTVRYHPAANVRHELLTEAVEIISSLFDGGYVNYTGRNFGIDSAKLWDLPDQRVPIGIAVSGPQSCATIAPVADAMVAVEPEAELVGMFDRATGPGAPRPNVGQVPVCWDADPDKAVALVHDQFRWFAGGWKGQRGDPRAGRLRRRVAVRPAGGRGGVAGLGGQRRNGSGGPLRAAVGGPQGVVGARAVDPAVGVRAEQVAQPLDQCGG
jgi:alkanesulfonate monooxygenase SsuD/methylene tetrahydromethanopterin reductase-like flavin-dependent oxidoreductase (luciferase family)